MAKILTRYDSEERKADEVTYNNNGKVIFKTTFKYDLNGNNIEMWKFDTNHVARLVFLRKFDSESKRTEVVKIRDGKMKGKNTFRYDKSGELFEQLWNYRELDTPLILRRYTYDYYKE